MEKSGVNKQDPKEVENHENDSNSKSTSDGTAVVDIPRNKLKKINNEHPDKKRVYKIVLTGGWYFFAFYIIHKKHIILR